MPLTFGIATVIRLLHNRSCKRLRRNAEALYAQEYAGKDIRQQIVAIAEEQHNLKKGGDVIIPVWLFEAMIKNSGSELSITDACKLYFDTVLTSNN